PEAAWTKATTESAMGPVRGPRRPPMSIISPFKRQIRLGAPNLGYRALRTAVSATGVVKDTHGRGWLIDEVMLT
ncbi:hypothetical protein ACFU44_25265, partial [Nocardia rhizosphaerihabitans]|uniref:hypothetical protein n=1 Tax=Nocardia rhizosphaerihabitans TaxID=1691570 RepID=UPI00366AAD78